MPQPRSRNSRTFVPNPWMTSILSSVSTTPVSNQVNWPLDRRKLWIGSSGSTDWSRRASPVIAGKPQPAEEKAPNVLLLPKFFRRCCFKKTTRSVHSSLHLPSHSKSHSLYIAPAERSSQVPLSIHSSSSPNLPYLARVIPFWRHLIFSSCLSPLLSSHQPKLCLRCNLSPKKCRLRAGVERRS